MAHNPKEQPTKSRNQSKQRKHPTKPRKPRQGDGFFALGERARLAE